MEYNFVYEWIFFKISDMIKKKRKEGIMETLQKIALVFTIIGAVVWGIYGLFDVNIVASLFGDQSMIARIVYILVGICGLINIGIFFTDLDRK